MKKTITTGFLSAIVLFFLANSSWAVDDHLIISEVLIGGNSSDEEFIELYNPSSTDIDLKSLPLKLHIVSSTGADTSKTMTYTSANSIIKARDYLLLASASFRNNHSEIAIGATYSAALVSNGAVYISTSATKDLNVVDSICWGKSTKCDFPLPDPKQNYSLERIENGSDWEESCEASGTPGKIGNECPPEPTLPAANNNTPAAESKPVGNTSTAADDSYSLSDKIYLNEIFPNPKTESDEEYIEIANGGEDAVDLFGWKLKDASKGKGYQFKVHTLLNPGEYLAVFRPDSKITLNNSKESVTLSNPQGKTASSVSWEKSINSSSYNFDGEVWKWSKYLTPGEKNKYDSEPVVKIEKPKNVYKNILSKFSAKAKDEETKKLKYTWDFGDGKKSYLKNTSHKYLDTGKYTVTLAVTDDSQTVEKNFAVIVKNSPRPDLELVKIVPNPAGADTEGEIIDVKNNSTKKVDLNGWKIATGSGEKMYNHPISGEFTLGPNEAKTITREFSKFSLNNKAGKVELVMSDGKMLDAVEYSKEKIPDDEAYVKISGHWQWVSPGAEEIADDSEEQIEIIDDPTGEIEAAEASDPDATGEILGASDENETAASAQYESNFSSEDAFIFLSDIGFLKSQNKEIDYCPLKNTTASLDYLLISSI
ncbi:MAG TPA: lamin tail domain-containing protein [Candidatus Bathyarchaeia archaeon]|nr:lamin tail domain-containing protein [Candidatus Bathyarchaeia archaeon]